MELFLNNNNKKRVVSTLFLFIVIFSSGCDFKSPEKWETPTWYLPLTIPLVDTKYGFAGMVDSSMIFSDSISDVIQIEFDGSIPEEGGEPLGIPDSIFRINMSSSDMELPEMGFGSGEATPIPMPPEIPDEIDPVSIPMADYSTIIEQFGCLPMTDPTTGIPILESIVELLPDTPPISVPIELPDLGITMFSINSAVFSKGEWRFAIDNSLFFDLDTANVLVTSGSNLLYQADLGPVSAGTNPIDISLITVDDSLSWNTISFQNDLIVVINIGVDASQEGKVDCLWNEDAPPLYTCIEPQDPVEAVKFFDNAECDLDNDGSSDCSGGLSNCSLLYFCGDNGYVGKSGSCLDNEYYGDFSSFSLSNPTGITPNPVVYKYTDFQTPLISFHYYDSTCNGLPVDDIVTECELYSEGGSPQTCTADCVIGYKEPNSGWDVSGNDDLSLDIDFTNKFETVRKVNISSTGWDTSITSGQAFPGFEGIAIKQAKVDTFSTEYPNKLSLNITNGLFADFFLQFDFINFFDEITQQSLSEQFIIPSNNGVIDTAIHFSEKILAYSLPSDQVIDSMVFNIVAGISAGDYSIYAQDNQITIGSPVFNDISMSNISLQYIEAITDSLTFPEIPSPPIEGIPDGFAGFEFYDIIFEMEFFNEIGIPVSLNMELTGTKGGVAEEKTVLINPNIGSPYSNFYCCDFNTVGDTVRTIIRLNKDGQTTEYYCSPQDADPSCICPGSDCLCGQNPCCNEIVEDDQTTIVDFMNFAPENISIGGEVAIDGTGILAPGSNIWGSFKLIAPLAFVFSEFINIIPAESTPMSPMDSSLEGQIDSSLVEAALNVIIANSSPLGGNLSLLVSDSTIFPLFFDSLITGKWDAQLKPNIWETIWDTLNPRMVIDSVYCTQIDLSECSLDDKIKTLEVKFFDSDGSLQFFIGRMFELGFPRSDSIEYHLGYINPEFPENYTSNLVIDKTIMDWVITDQQRYNIPMITLQKSLIQSIEGADTSYIPLTFQTSNFIGIKAYLTLTLNIGGLGRENNLGKTTSGGN